MADELIGALLRLASAQGLVVLDCVRDRDGRVCDLLCSMANPAALQMLGAGQADLVGMRLGAGASPLGDPILFQSLLATANSGQPASHDLTAAAERGPRRFRVSWAKAGDQIVLSIVPGVTREDPKPQGGMKYGMPDTLFDTVPQAMFIADQAGRYLAVNAALTDLLQLPADRMLGRTMLAELRLAAPDAAEAEPPERTVLTAGAPGEARRIATLPDGTTRSLRIRMAPLRSDHRAVTGLVGVVEDLTMEQQATESLRVNEQRLRHILEGGLQGIAIVQDGRIVFANSAYATMFGYSSVEELMTLDSVTRLVTPAERERLTELATRRLAGEPVPDRYEMECLHKDGSRFWVYVTVRIVEWNGRLASQAAFVDITDRKLAELALRESERALQTAEAVAHVGSWSLRIGVPGSLTWSDETFRIYGMPKEEFDGNLGTVLERVHPDDRRSVQMRIGESIRDRRPYLSEHRVTDPEGSVRLVHEEAELQLDPAGNPAAFAGYVQDITESRKAQLALEDSERRLRQILEGSLTGIAVGQEGKIVFINEVGAQLHGYGSAAEIVGQPIDAMVPPEYRPLQSLPPKGGTGWPSAGDQWEVEYLRKDGSRFWVLVRGKEVQWEGKPAFQVTFMDISASKEAEDALRTANSRLMDAVDSLPGRFALYDKEGRFVLCNTNTREQWGDAADILAPGTPFETIARAAAQQWSREEGHDREARVQAILDLFHTKHGTLEVRTNNNRIFQWRVSRGNSGSSLVVGMDITEERQREEQFRQTQKLEAIGQLTGGVAHDFNNLLTVILSNAEILSARAGPDTSAASVAQSIVQAAQRGAELTQRLLAYARRQPLKPVELDLNRVISAMEPLLRRTLGEPIEIEVVRQARLWPTVADEGQVQNALLNLAVNARDAMPIGGKLRVETGNVELGGDQADLKPGQYVMLAVSDTGVGMPAHVSERAFDPFFTTKPLGKGTGLGLSMVYGFVKQSGGHVQIDSKPGQGTSVRIYLPRYTGPTPAAGRASGSYDDTPQGTETILLVEDDPLVRGSVVGQLLSLGYTVKEADGADAALTVLRSGAPIDLLFTDVVLRGGMNGRELAAAARDLVPNLRVLYTSGYSEDAIIHHGRLDPDVQLLGKPFLRADLARELRKALG